MNDDQRLHEAFQAERAVDRAQTPAFARVMAGRAGLARRRRGLVPAVVGLGGAIAVLLVALRSRGPSDPARDIDLARQVMAWQSRTDFLLPPSVPGLLSSVPRFDGAPAGSPLQALDPGNVLGPPALPRSPRS